MVYLPKIGNPEPKKVKACILLNILRNSRVALSDLEYLLHAGDQNDVKLVSLQRVGASALDALMPGDRACPARA